MILQSVAMISITDLHVMVTCCISCQSIFIPPMYYRIPALELSLSVPLVLQAVFRRAGARGLIYDFLLLSCGIRLLMFQPCFDRILICELFGPWYSTQFTPKLQFFLHLLTFMLFQWLDLTKNGKLWSVNTCNHTQNSDTFQNFKFSVPQKKKVE